MWLAVRSTGLTANNASRVRVLVNGASGGLGSLALQMLHKWGCEVTAICGLGKAGECVALGAVDARERGPTIIASLPSDFDVVLNFGSWDDDFSLASRLGRDALGHATTVHPLLENFDRFGWFRGALISRRQWKAGRSAVAERAPGTRYDWTLFKPDSEALDVLVAGLRERTFSLPVGMCASFDNAMTAFAHVAAGRSGRAVLLPHGATPIDKAGPIRERSPNIQCQGAFKSPTSRIDRNSFQASQPARYQSNAARLSCFAVLASASEEAPLGVHAKACAGRSPKRNVADPYSGPGRCAAD
jgi:hypothetical protein